MAKYTPIKKSRSNTSGRPSEAKRMSERKVNSGKAPPTAAGPKRSYRLSVPEAKTARQLPETAQTKKGVSLRKLLRGTPRLMHANARYVDILEFKKTGTKSGMPAARGICISRDPYRPSKVIRKHKTYIIGADRDEANNALADTPINKHKKVLVSCDCVTGDTQVLTSDGWKTVYEIAEHFVPDYYPIRYIVRGKLYAGSAPFYRGIADTFTVVSTTGQRLVSATADHRFLSLSDTQEETWLEVSNMARGTRLVSADGGFITVKEVVFNKNCAVYDITVPGPTCFNANGIIAHNCESFMYTWEYANAAHGASRIIYCNGEPPVVLNPSLAFGLCIARGALITTEKCVKPIENVSVGDKVLTLGGYSNVSYAGSTGEKDVIRLRLSSGSTLDCTPDHPILVATASGLQWVEADKLDDSHYIVSLRGYISTGKNTVNIEQYHPKKYNATYNAIVPKKMPTVMSISLAKLLGYVISDGWVYNTSIRGVRGGFSQYDRKTMLEFVRVFEECFGILPTARKLRAFVTLGKYVSTFLLNLGLGGLSKDQKIPNSILIGPKQVMVSFLTGLYEGDGYAAGRVSTYATASYLLARQLQTVLFSFGVYTRINSQRSGVIGTKMYLVRTSSVEETQKLLDLLPGLKKGEKIGSFEHNNTRHRALPFNLTDVIQQHTLSYIHNLSIGDQTCVVPVYSALASFGLQAKHSECCKRLACLGRLQKIPSGHDRPLNAGTMRDIVHVMLPTIKNLVLSNIRGISRTMSNPGRSELRNKAHLRKILAPMDLYRHPNLAAFLNFLVRDDVILDTLVSKKKIGKKTVYDLTVEEQEHFVANGFVVHNCKHLVQLAHHLIDSNL